MAQNIKEILKAARSTHRAGSRVFIDKIFKNFIELHGDKCLGDDRAIIGGLAFLNDIPVTILAHEKGSNINERIKCNFGQAQPEGYRKALRLMKQAEKFKRPIISFIDTPGAYPGIEAEEHGQGYMIAQMLKESIALETPFIAVFIGEGGSGGALALAVADEIWMLENAIFSVITPEGCASILWKDIKYTELAAENLKITAADLKNFGLIDQIIEENKTMFEFLKEKLYEKIIQLKKIDNISLINNRYQKFRKIFPVEI